MNTEPFDSYVTRWRLAPDGLPVITRNSRLLPVRRDGEPAMLKIATHDEERRGAILMDWWKGEGAARVLASDGNAILLERLTGELALADMVRAGRDDEASCIICLVAARLHAPRPAPVPELMPLAAWFAELELVAAHHGGVLLYAAAAARALLSEPRETVVLHGDLHHGNVLDGGPRGWLAIDPKGLLGERGFDFANILCNPDLLTATTPGRLARQVGVVAQAAQLDRARLLHWVLAYAGLSAAWDLAEGADPKIGLRVAEMALATIQSATGTVAMSNS